MRITSVDTVVLTAPLVRSIGGSARRPPITSRELVLVRIHTDSGVTGYGESYGIGPLIHSIIDQWYRPLLVGRDPLHTEVLWNDMYRHTGYHGPKGLMIEAMSAIDIALWDIKGRVFNQPLFVLLGGTAREDVPCYAASVYLGSPREAVAQAEAFVEQGFDILKIKVGQGPEADLANVQAVRRAVGENVRLLADANCAYDAKTAIRLGRELDEMGVEWFEEPVAVDDIVGYSIVRQNVPQYVVGSEGEYTRFGFRDLIEHRAVDVVQPDLTRVGGITEGAHIATMAHAAHLLFSPHCWGSVIGLAAAIHLSAAVPNFLLLEYDANPNPIMEALVGDQLTPHRGRVRLPHGPGLGLDIDEDAIENLRHRG
jgi:D-galactarolactone cycloisomerase